MTSAAQRRPSPSPASLAERVPVWLLETNLCVTEGVRPHRHDLRIERHGTRFLWAMSTASGPTGGTANNLADLFDAAIALARTAAGATSHSRGIALHCAWGPDLLMYRSDVTAYLAIAHPTVVLAPLRRDSRRQAMWALLGQRISNLQVEQCHALPPGPSRHGRSLIIATDASIKGRHTGWAYVTSEGRYKTRAHLIDGESRQIVRRRWSSYPLEVRAIRWAIADHATISTRRRVVILSDNRAAVNLMRAYVKQHPHLSGINICWTRGHNGHLLNEAADRLCRLARISDGPVEAGLAKRITDEAGSSWAQRKR